MLDIMLILLGLAIWFLRDVFIMFISIIPGILYGVHGVPEYFCDALDKLPSNANVVYAFLYPFYRVIVGIVMGPIDYYNTIRTKLCQYHPKK